MQPSVGSGKSINLTVSGDSGTLEIGSAVARVLTATFGAGQILNGDGSSGPALVGPATSYSFTGTGISTTNQPGNTLSITSAVVNGVNNWAVTVSHNAGTGGLHRTLRATHPRPHCRDRGGDQLNRYHNHSPEEQPMAVTKQTYTATPTWTAAQLATIYRSAFIDAGLMTDWHDSFLSGSVENRVLRVQYDASKTYGTTFYWFMFTTSGAFLHVATGWNTATDQPTGTQFLDFFATTTNATTNHWQFSGALSSTTAADLIRYSSGNQHWFVSRQGKAPHVIALRFNRLVIRCSHG